MEPIIIGDLLVWPEDLDMMTWHKAMEEVKELGPDWRLPTIEELEETLYPNRKRIPNMKGTSYWSSTEDINAQYFNFNNGYAFIGHKNHAYYVRPVRSFTGDTAMELLLKDF